MTPQDFEAWCRAWERMPSDDEFWSDMAANAMRAQIEAAEQHPEVTLRCAEAWVRGIAWATFWPSLAAVLWRLA